MAEALHHQWQLDKAKKMPILAGLKQHTGGCMSHHTSILPPHACPNLPMVPSFGCRAGTRPRGATQTCFWLPVRVEACRAHLCDPAALAVAQQAVQLQAGQLGVGVGNLQATQLLLTAGGGRASRNKLRNSPPAIWGMGLACQFHVCNAPCRDNTSLAAGVSCRSSCRQLAHSTPTPHADAFPGALSRSP